LFNRQSLQHSYGPGCRSPGPIPQVDLRKARKFGALRYGNMVDLMEHHWKIIMFELLIDKSRMDLMGIHSLLLSNYQRVFYDNTLLVIVTIKNDDGL
jgi:hypothetical protein